MVKVTHFPAFSPMDKRLSIIKVSDTQRKLDSFETLLNRDLNILKLLNFFTKRLLVISNYQDGKKPFMTAVVMVMFQRLEKYWTLAVW